MKIREPVTVEQQGRPHPCLSVAGLSEFIDSRVPGGRRARQKSWRVFGERIGPHWCHGGLGDPPRHERGIDPLGVTPRVGLHRPDVQRSHRGGKGQIVEQVPVGQPLTNRRPRGRVRLRKIQRRPAQRHQRGEYRRLARGDRRQEATPRRIDTRLVGRRQQTERIEDAKSEPKRGQRDDVAKRIRRPRRVTVSKPRSGAHRETAGGASPRMIICSVPRHHRGESAHAVVGAPTVS